MFFHTKSHVGKFHLLRHSLSRQKLGERLKSVSTLQSVSKVSMGCDPMRSPLSLWVSGCHNIDLWLFSSGTYRFPHNDLFLSPGQSGRHYLYNRYQKRTAFVSTTQSEISGNPNSHKQNRNWLVHLCCSANIIYTSALMRSHVQYCNSIGNSVRFISQFKHRETSNGINANGKVRGIDRMLLVLRVRSQVYICYG